jgi:hypothetical protein
MNNGDFVKCHPSRDRQFHNLNNDKYLNTLIYISAQGQVSRVLLIQDHCDCYHINPTLA